MFPYFRSASKLIPSSIASTKRRPIRKQERRNRLTVLSLEDRVTPSSTINFNLSSPSVVAHSSSAISLGTVSDEFVNPGALSSSSISIDWGDGHTDHSATVTPISPGSATYSISEGHNYASAGSFPVTVTDSNAHASATTTVNVTPVVPASGIAFNLSTSSVPVSTSASGTSVSLGTFTDTNVTAGDLSNTSISIDWGDGSVTSGTAVATLPPSNTYYIFGGTGNGQVHNYATTGTYTVTVTVTDDGGVNSDSASTKVTATTPVASNGISFNLVSPTIALTNAAAISLGSITDTNVTGGTLASSAVTIDWGDGKSDTKATVSAIAPSSTTYSISDSHTYASTGDFTVTVTVDDGVHSAPMPTTVHVVSLPANTVSFDLVSPEVPVNSTSTTDTLGTFSDTNTGGFTTAIVNWGDGSGDTTASLTALPNLPNSYTINLNHQYGSFGTFTATVTVTDSTGSFSASTPVTVYSTALAITPSPITGSPKNSVTLTQTFKDPGSTLGSGSYSATVDWGDGSPVSSVANGFVTVSGSNGVYTISANHTYATAGRFTVQVTATRAGSLPFSTATAFTTAIIAVAITPTAWMDLLPDSIPLTDLSIPGTHQSAAGGNLLTELTGDQDLLDKAKEAQERATDGDIAAFVADGIALAGAELVPPLVGIAAAADAAASILDGLAAGAWKAYEDSLGANSYTGLKDDANTLFIYASTLSTANGASAVLHTAAAIADAAAEGEGEANPFADALQAIVDTSSAAEDAEKLADYALFFVGGAFDAAGFIGEDKFDTDLDAAREKAAELQTQTLSIADQLNSGIRALDIRGGTPVGGQIEIYSGTQDLGTSLKDVLNDATAFLQAHPSETIVLTLRSNEDAAVDTTTFNTDLSTLLGSSDTAVTGTHNYSDFVYTSASPTTTPDLGQVRGKIVIIPYAPDSSSVQTGSSFGWQPTIVDENSSGVSDAVTLWNNAEGHNQTAGLLPTDLGNPNTLYVNNLASEDPGTPPIGIAADVSPFAEQAFLDPNTFHVSRTTGIVGIDNPDTTLIDEIIAENNPAIVVTSDADSGVGSLRAAITQADSQPGVNTIEFSSSMSGPSEQLIVLQSDLPAITNDVDIVGTVYIEGNHHKVFQNSAQHTVKEVDFVASTVGVAATTTSSTSSVPLVVNISGLTVFDHVAFTTAPQVLIAGDVSKPMILQLQDTKNSPVTVAAGAPPLVVNLTTTSTPTLFAHAEFRDSTGVSLPITSVNFTAGNSNAQVFTYYDEKRGTPTLTAAVGTVPVATQTEKVNANVPVSIAFFRQPGSGYASTSIAPSVQLMDKFHNFVAFIPVTLTLNPVNVPAMATGSKPVLRGTHSVKTPDNLNALASFSNTTVNLPGVYTVTATITVNGKKLSVTSNQFTITANPKTVTTKVR
jgi:PKD repeat protein